jgi:ABC-type glycerol-3-phosphate transport system substrate-binding protein
MTASTSRRFLAGGVILGLLLAGCRAAPAATPTPTAVPSPSPTLSHPVPSPYTTGEPTPATTLTGHVSLWLDWGPAEMAALRILMEGFILANPGVEFDLTYYATAELQATFEAAAADGRGPTILLGPDVWGPLLWRANLIQEVSGLLAPGMREAIQPLALGQAVYGNAVLGVPLEMQGVVLYANRQLMPAPAGTVEDLLRSRGAPDLGFDFSGSQLATCGGAWIGEDGAPTFDGPAGVCWLELMTTVAQADPVTYNTDDDLALFEAGQAAWLLDGTWNRERLEDALGVESLAIDSWPIDDRTHTPLSGFVWTENAYLAAGLDPSDLAASWEFVRFLLSQEVQTTLSEVDGAAHLPAAAGIWLTDPLMEQAAAVVSLGTPFPIQPEIERYRGPVERSIFAILRQGAEPEIAIQRAAAEIRAALAPASPEG